jgi:lipopolysaccharide export LptBFGC system permease protein LptF
MRKERGFDPLNAHCWYRVSIMATKVLLFIFSCFFKFSHERIKTTLMLFLFIFIFFIFYFLGGHPIITLLKLIDLLYEDVRRAY